MQTSHPESRTFKGFYMRNRDEVYTCTSIRGQVEECLYTHGSKGKGILYNNKVYVTLVCRIGQLERHHFHEIERSHDLTCMIKNRPVRLTGKIPPFPKFRLHISESLRVNV